MTLFFVVADFSFKRLSAIDDGVSFLFQIDLRSRRLLTKGCARRGPPLSVTSRIEFSDVLESCPARCGAGFSGWFRFLVAFAHSCVPHVLMVELFIVVCDSEFYLACRGHDWSLFVFLNRHP